MIGQNSIKFDCPLCGQSLEADYDMAGTVIYCPACDQPLRVPGSRTKPHDAGSDWENSDTGDRQGAMEDGAKTVQSATSVRTGGRIREKILSIKKRWMQAIAAAVVLLIVGIIVAVIGAPRRAVARSVECLVHFVEEPTSMRMQALSKSMESCPEDFREAAKEFLSSVTKTSDDLITSQDREGMAKLSALLGLVGGASNQYDPQGGVSAGLQLGDLISMAVEEEAGRKLRRGAERKLDELIDVANKYGVDCSALRFAVTGKIR